MLTASRATESSFEEDGTHSRRRIRSDPCSAGLWSKDFARGNADADRDGLVSVLEAYEYASERVRDSGERQNPADHVPRRRTHLLGPVPTGKAGGPGPAAERPTTRGTNRSGRSHGQAGSTTPIRKGSGSLGVPWRRRPRKTLRKSAGWLRPIWLVSSRIRCRPPQSRFRPPSRPPPPSPAAVAKTAPATVDTADAVATKAESSPWAGNPARRWARLAAVITIVAVAGTIAAVSIKIDLSRRGSPPSCAAATQPGFHQVTVLSGATGTNLVICPVQVDHGQQPGLNVSLSGRIIGQPPSGQVLTVVSQPDQDSCATDGTPGSGGYYLVGTLHPAAATHGDWNVTSGDYVLRRAIHPAAYLLPARAGKRRPKLRPGPECLWRNARRRRRLVAGEADARRLPTARHAHLHSGRAGRSATATTKQDKPQGGGP